MLAFYAQTIDSFEKNFGINTVKMYGQRICSEMHNSKSVMIENCCATNKFFVSQMWTHNYEEKK